MLIRRLTSLLVVPAAVLGQGSMHPQIGFPPNCRLNVTNDCAPSYATLANATELWPCPDGAKASQGSTWPDQCVAGSGPNPLCAGKLTDADPCCCPKDGCWAEPKFNTVLGVCKGGSCACGGANTRAASCAPQGDADKCGTLGGTPCTGDSVACCFGSNVERLVPFYDAGTRAKINYLAAYQFDAATQQWVQQPESSFNTDGRAPAYDLTVAFGGLPKEQAWLAPQPGGSVYWGLGYYAAGVQGVGPPGAMFVLSTEEWWGGTWYMLNQLELDRGPAVNYEPSSACPSSMNDNCWAAGNAGEMDFLEPAWQSGKADDPSVTSSYRASWATQNNQVGRMFNGGVNTGGFASDNYLLTAGQEGGEPIVYVAVVDQVGNWVYRIPADEAAQIWPGIGRKTIAKAVQAAPTRTPTSVNPCTSGFCATFTSNCQATNVTEARAQGCPFNGDQGFCGNWFAPMADTHQPLFPSSSCKRDVRGGFTMPWCVEMVGGGAPPVHERNATI